MNFDVVGLGALNIDKLYKVNRIADSDEAGIVRDYNESCGGSAPNSIVNLAKFGLETGMVGKIADDREGNMHISEFEEWDVDTSGIILSENGRSGSAIGYVDAEGERAFYIDPGVNDEIRSGEIDLEYLEKAKWLHLSSFIGDEAFEVQKEIVEELDNSVKISLDPGCIYAQKGLDSLKPILERTSLFFPNESELKTLTSDKVKEGAQRIVELGVDIVAVKLGGEGSFITDGEEEYKIDSRSVDVVDTTGAGDAFNSGFLYGVLNGKGLRECGEMGDLAASKCITSMGGRLDFDNLPDLEDF